MKKLDHDNVVTFLISERIKDYYISTLLVHSMLILSVYKSLITEEILKDFYQRQNSRKKHMFVFLHKRHLPENKIFVCKLCAYDVVYDSKNDLQRKFYASTRI